MTTHFKALEKKVRALDSREKAALARTLIEDLDGNPDSNAELIWAEEAQRRYQAYKSGELGSVPGEETMQRARNRLK
ncbi:addiction module protein [Nitrosomonas sp.]|uniref:addiction module protein n=1 Tax=Nitrosomonas sp. TaxID=42353 RepID=UPI0037CC1956